MKRQPFSFLALLLSLLVFSAVGCITGSSTTTAGETDNDKCGASKTWTSGSLSDNELATTWIDASEQSDLNSGNRVIQIERLDPPEDICTEEEISIEYQLRVVVTNGILESNILSAVGFAYAGPGHSTVLLERTVEPGPPFTVVVFKGNDHFGLKGSFPGKVGYASPTMRLKIKSSGTFETDKAKISAGGSMIVHYLAPK